MSLENLRDAYKSSGQTNDVRLKLNGATYRKVRSEFSRVKFGNLIRLGQYNGARCHELEELNQKYDLAFDLPKENGEYYSLNKKKRWLLARDLVGEMPQFAYDDIDVRLYETRNRSEKGNNCIAVHKSKGDQISVKKTYANLKSIKKIQEIHAKVNDSRSRDDEAKPRVPKKNRKCSKPTPKENNQAQNKTAFYSIPLLYGANSQPLLYYVSRKEEETQVDKTPCIQYEIEYAPKSDVLKYGAKQFAKERKIGKATKLNKFSAKNHNYDSDVDRSDCDDDFSDNEKAKPVETRLDVDMDDLLEQQLIKMAEKNSLKEFKSSIKLKN